MPEIVGIRREDACSCLSGNDDHMCIHDVGSAGPAQKLSDLMTVLRGEADDITASQEAPKLHLPGRAADLGDDGCGRCRDDAQLKAGSVIGPHLPIVAVGGDQHTGVVENAHAERAGLELKVSTAMRRRAASSSASVKGPRSCSHSVTARSPSRIRSAHLAACVIQAETLTPSSAAAESIPSWTSGSTVIASLGEGLPRAMAKVYYQSRRLRTFLP